MYILSFSLTMLAMFAILLTGMLLAVRKDSAASDEEACEALLLAPMTHVMGVPTRGRTVERTRSETGAPATR